jgi:hypothetical protein
LLRRGCGKAERCVVFVTETGLKATLRWISDRLMAEAASRGDPEARVVHMNESIHHKESTRAFRGQRGALAASGVEEPTRAITNRV